MTGDDVELYRDALAALDEAQQRREEQFPRLEALRLHYHDEFDRPAEDDEKRIIVDMVIRDVEALFDPEKDDPVDFREWLNSCDSDETPAGQDTGTEGSDR